MCTSRSKFLMQFLRSSCRFTLVQSELSIIIIGTALWKRHLLCEGKENSYHVPSMGGFPFKYPLNILQEKLALQQNSATFCGSLKVVLFDQGFGDKLPCDISRPGV